MDNNLKATYAGRMNEVFTYIDQHLSGDLSLEKIAGVAHFSPFHFHRLFKFITGETPGEYVQRRRIEKSVSLLLHQQKSVSEIAHVLGFSDGSAYSKAFKKFYGINPSAFRQEHPHRLERIQFPNSKIGHEYPDAEAYLRKLNHLKAWINMEAKIEVKEIAPIEVAYINCTGPQNLAATFQQLISWAAPKGLFDPTSKMATVYYDSFKVTPAEKVRMSACLLLESPLAAEGAIGLRTLAGGKYIVGSYEILVEEFEKSWTALFLWMNENGYAMGDAEPFEIYHNNFNEHPEKKAIVDFYIPVKK
ncbi:GyrI-like domain-containing protein [Persicobacter sp. CCB-QB2]|uniref:AraC family transcriptional regulator n=1 Tax=Persicobacter sp. CCB-QB2 TaxID=1561025 RepID=UPI0006A9DF95|nr:GyrI-like domain-containing protein [Persicobacter sp. CCB-QB2]